MKTLWGTFIGDTSGSLFEGRMFSGDRLKFGPYTDDTEQAYGVVLWLKSGNHTLENFEKMLRYVYSGDGRGYGRNTKMYLENKPCRKDSFGNGSAMRAAPIGEYCKDVKTVIKLATLNSSPTHNHPDAVSGSVTLALLAFLIKNKRDTLSIKEIYPKALMPEPGKKYVCSLEARESVPPAINAFLTGNSFEDVIFKALHYGGDTDTIAAMAGALAALKFPIPKTILNQAVNAHPDNKKIAEKIRNPVLPKKKLFGIF